MRTKQLAVQATAPAPIGADPIDEFIKNLPKKTEILGARESCSAERSVIYVTYKFEGRLCQAMCSYIIDRSVSADIKGGYELSSPTGFKGCFLPKDIKTIRNDGDVCLVFEGFWDFLLYLTIQKVEKTKHDVVILNSVANIEKAMSFIKKYSSIYTYLDNDDAGRKTTKLIQSVHSNVYNRSTQYNEYKDLNDYLCGEKPVVKPEVQKKKTGLKIH